MDYFLLSDSPLFKGMIPAEVEDILALVPYHVRKFQSGSMISQSGEMVESLIIVMNGIVKGEMVDYAGRVIKIEDITAPGALASAFIFGNKNRFPVNVIAISLAVKRYFSFVSGIPMPLSHIFSIIPSSLIVFSLRSILILPPLGVYLTAFDNRFLIT